MERKCGKLGGELPRGTSMHKDESTGANIAPTNQSDSGWRAQLSWQFPNCDKNMSHIQLCVIVCVWTDLCATMSTDIGDSCTPQTHSYHNRFCLKSQSNNVQKCNSWIIVTPPTADPPWCFLTTACTSFHTAQVQYHQIFIAFFSDWIALPWLNRKWSRKLGWTADVKTWLSNPLLHFEGSVSNLERYVSPLLEMLLLLTISTPHQATCYFY